MIQNKPPAVLVTGANRGIGLAVVEKLASQGINIIACTRSSTPEFLKLVESLSLAYSVEIKNIVFDLRDINEIKHAMREVGGLGYDIQGLVNNAAEINVAPALLTSLDLLNASIGLNFTSQIIIAQYLARIMIRQKTQGAIVFISSTAAIDGNEGRLAYSSGKSAIQAATKVMSRELGIYGIRVNCVAPGLTDTDMMNDSTPLEVKSDMLKRLSLRRVARPSEIAGVIKFLLSADASYITGQTIRVDGGM